MLRTFRCWCDGNGLLNRIKLHSYEYKEIPLHYVTIFTINIYVEDFMFTLTSEACCKFQLAPVISDTLDIII